MYPHGFALGLRYRSRARVAELAVRAGAKPDAIRVGRASGLLIDEIDKADIEFPNDLLQELAEWNSSTRRARREGGRRPIVVITSNNETGIARRIPAPLLLPLHPLSRSGHDDGDHRVHFPGIKQRLVSEAQKLFYESATCRHEEEASTSSC